MKTKHKNSTGYLDFSPLDNPSTFKLFSSINISAAITILTGAGALAIAIAFNTVDHDTGSIAVVGMFLIVGTVFAYSKYWTSLRKSSEKKNINAFVDLNNWQLSELEGVDHIATSLLAAGHSFKILHAFNGAYKDLGFEARIVSYVTGYDKSAVTHNFVCLQFSYKHVLPFMQITRWETKFIGDANLKCNLVGTQELQLEGDFSNNYNLSIVPGTQQRVLQFMTPDFMSEVLDLPPNSNFEFADTSMFVIAAFADAASYQLSLAMRQAFVIADSGIKQMHDISRSWDASLSSEDLTVLAASANSPREILFASAPEPW